MCGCLTAAMSCAGADTTLVWGSLVVTHVTLGQAGVEVGVTCCYKMLGCRQCRTHRHLAAKGSKNFGPFLQVSERRKRSQRKEAKKAAARHRA